MLNLTPNADPVAKADSESRSSVLWMNIIGACFLGIAVIFIMALIVASLFDRAVPEESRFLVCSLLALIMSIGSGFLGGSAVASGQISVPKFLQNPISFGLTGGVAVFVIVLILSSFAYSYLTPEKTVIVPPSTPEPPTAVPVITNVNTTQGDAGNIIVAIAFQPEILPSQYKLFVEIASDVEFKRLTKPRFLIDNPDKGGPVVILIKKPIQSNYWVRLVIDKPDGQTASKGNSVAFEVPIS